MDRMFQGTSNPGRLSRRPMETNRLDDSPDDKPQQNQRFNRNRNQPEKQTIQNNQPARYGANRRAPVQKPVQEQQPQKPQIQTVPQNSRYGANKRVDNTRNKNQQTTTKNNNTNYSIIRREDIKKQTSQIQQESSEIKPQTQQPRYGTNRRNVNPVKKQQPQQPKKVQVNPPSTTRRLQRKTDANLQKNTPIKQQQIFQPVTSRYASSRRAPIPAQKLQGQKLEEVQNIVRRPLLNRKGPQTPRNNQTIHTVKQPEIQQKKRTTPNSFIDDFIRPVQRKGRYGEDVKKSSDVKQQQTKIQEQTPKRNLARNTPNNRLTKKQETPKNEEKPIIPPNNRNRSQNPSILSVQSNIQTQSVIEQSNTTEEIQRPVYKPRKGRPGAQQKPKQQSKIQSEQSKPIINDPIITRNRGKIATKKAQQVTETQTQQSKITNNSIRNTRNDLQASSSNLSQSQQNTRTNPTRNQPRKVQKTPQKQQKQQITRSNIIIKVLSKIGTKKRKQYFNALKKSAKVLKQKNNVFAKILIKSLINIETKNKYETMEILIQKLSMESQQRPDISQIAYIPKYYENITKNNNNILPQIINHLYLNKLQITLNKLKHNINLRNKTKDFVDKAFRSLQIKKIRFCFAKIKEYNKNKDNKMKKCLQNLGVVNKIIVRQALRYGLLRIINNCIQNKAKQQPISPKKSVVQSPITTKSPIKQSQNQQNLQKIRNQYAQLVTTHNNQKQQWRNQQAIFQQNLDILKGNCLQEQQLFDQKKRLISILKQKIQQIQIPQEDFIKDDHNLPLQDTKYSLLLDIYIYLLKQSKQRHFEISQLNKQFPYLIDDSQQDVIVTKWKQLLANKKLKQQIDAYEGITQTQRKTAHILQQQSDLITAMAKSYIKQKYIWGWVKNSINNAISTA